MTYNALQSESCSPVKMFLIPISGQHQQYHRPYESHLDGDNMQQLMNSTNGGQHVDPSSLMGVSGNILAPSVLPQGEIVIPNGFQETRYAFFLEVMVTGIFGVRREVYSGYTNYSGITSSGAIDPNMEFYINGFVEIAEVTQVGPHGQQMSMNSRGSYQVLSTVEKPIAPIMTIRPQDVVGYGQLGLVTKGGRGVSDLRTQISSAPKLSSTDNLLTNEYLSKMCTSYMNAATQVGDDFGSGASDLYNAAYSYTLVPSFEENKFVRAVGRQGMANGCMFTYGDIERLWTLSDSFCIMAQSDSNGLLANPLEYTQHWAGANVETSVAAGLSNTLPPLLSKYLLISAEVECTNIHGGQPSVVLYDYVEMFPNSFSAAQLKALENEILHHVVNGMMDKLSNSFYLKLSLRILSNSLFEISLNGAAFVPYVVPMYCGSLLSPMLTTDTGSLYDMGVTVENIVSHLSPVINDGFTLNGFADGYADDTPFNQAPDFDSTPLGVDANGIIQVPI